MSTVASLLDLFVIKSLPGFGFSIETNTACNHFLNKLKQFIADLAKHYDDEIELQLAKPACAKSRAELVSWANSEISEVFISALGQYRDRIWDHEHMVPQRDKIRCEVALSYLLWLVELTESSKRQKIEAYHTTPRSTKHQKKRNGHAWTPYGIPISFVDMARRLGL